MQLSAISLALTRPSGDPLTMAALGIMRKPGVESHAFIPGIGWVSGLSLSNTIMEDGTQAASVDNPMGYMGDPIATVGPELVTNGDFSAGATGWTAQASTYSVTAGVATITATGSSGRIEQIAPALVAGRTYEFSATLTNGTAAGCRIEAIRGAAGGFAAIVVGPTVTGASQTVVLRFTAAGSDAIFQAKITSGTSGTFSVDNISVRELVGAIPARQATTANKPILRRGAVNRLARSEDLADAGWTKTGLTLSGNVISGATGTAWSGGNVLQRQTLPLQSSLTYTLVLRVRSAGSTTVTVIARDQSTGNTSQTVAPLSGSDWQFVTVQRTTGAATTALGIVIGGTNGDIEFGGAGCFQGTLSADQIAAQGGIPLTTTAAASSPTGPYWAEFDGTDFLSLAAVPFQQADDHVVIAGMASTAAASVWAFSIGADTANFPSICNLGTTSGGQPRALWRDDANVTISLVKSVSPPPLGAPFVITGFKRGSVRELRVNGASVGTSSTALGTTNATAASIGRFATGGAVYSGAIYPAVVIRDVGGVLTDADVAILERYVAQASGVQL